MSTISQTPKINTTRTLSIRNVSLLFVAALIVAATVFFSSVAGSPAAKPIDHGAYMLYRQGEWLSVPIRLSNAEAYQIFRRGEVISPLSNAEAYQLFRKGEVVSLPVLTNAEAYHLFRLGEWISVNIPAVAVDMTAYHLSERTLTDPNAGLAIYQLSEHALIDPLAGLAIYLNSERTSIPVRNLTQFNEYQRSEWFRK